MSALTFLIKSNHSGLLSSALRWQVTHCGLCCSKASGSVTQTSQLTSLGWPAHSLQTKALLTEKGNIWLMGNSFQF